MTDVRTESRDAAMAQMLYSANSKSVGVAYLLWFFLGGFGGHRFYAGKTGSAVAQLLLMLVGIVTLVVAVGAFLMFAVGVWVLIDAFLIPGWIRNHNTLLAHQMAR
jgi:TM2 domain-containing membrane protein YozV